MRVLDRFLPVQAVALAAIVSLGVLSTAGCGQNDSGTPPASSNTTAGPSASGTPSTAGNAGNPGNPGNPGSGGVTKTQGALGVSGNPGLSSSAGNPGSSGGAGTTGK